jgi:hypothetical protein
LALTAMDAEAVCRRTGIEIAHWLFWQKRTVGAW